MRFLDVDEPVFEIGRLLEANTFRLNRLTYLHRFFFLFSLVSHKANSGGW